MARGYGKKARGGAGKRIKPGKKGSMGKAGGMRTFFGDRIMKGR